MSTLLNRIRELEENNDMQLGFELCNHLMREASSLDDLKKTFNNFAVGYSRGEIITYILSQEFHI